jgi:hypothetical protein
VNRFDHPAHRGLEIELPVKIELPILFERLAVGFPPAVDESLRIEIGLVPGVSGFGGDLFCDLAYGEEQDRVPPGRRNGEPLDITVTVTVNHALHWAAS